MTEGHEAGGAETGDEGGFETLLDELEGIVARLERGELTLEQSLAAFERGTALSRRADAILAAAEARVEVLVAGPDGPSREPFSVDLGG
jgi:exodeoxyribonuclease VII small subunit